VRTPTRATPASASTASSGNLERRPVTSGEGRRLGQRPSADRRRSRRRRSTVVLRGPRSLRWRRRRAASRRAEIWYRPTRRRRSRGSAPIRCGRRPGTIEHAGGGTGERYGQTPDYACLPRRRLDHLHRVARLRIRPDPAEDIDAGAGRCKRRVADRHRQYAHRAIAPAVGRRDDLRVHRRSVVTADHIDGVADPHRARVGACLRRSFPDDCPRGRLDLGRTRRNHRPASDHENPPADRRAGRVVSRLRQGLQRRQATVSRVEAVDAVGRGSARGQPAEDHQAARPFRRHHDLSAEWRGQPPGEQTRLGRRRPRRPDRVLRPAWALNARFGFPLAASQDEAERQSNADRQDQQGPPAQPVAPRHPSRPCGPTDHQPQSRGPR